MHTSSIKELIVSLCIHTESKLASCIFSDVDCLPCSLTNISLSLDKASSFSIEHDYLLTGFNWRMLSYLKLILKVLYSWDVHTELKRSFWIRRVQVRVYTREDKGS